MLRRSRIALAAAALSIASFALVAHAGPFGNVGKGRIKIEAEAKPALGKFDGSCSEIAAKEEGGKLVFTAKLYESSKNKKGEEEDKFHLDMGLRQSHTIEAFEVKKYPTVKLVVDKSKVKIPAANGEKTTGSVTGDLTLHGKTKPVTVNYSLKREGSNLIANDTAFTFNYQEFGVGKISRLGIRVENPVTITVVSLKLKDN